MDTLQFLVSLHPAHAASPADAEGSETLQATSLFQIVVTTIS